jgi:hypothetical protein
MLIEYQSQVELKRPYVSPQFVHSAATFRGFQSRTPLAEAYEAIFVERDHDSRQLAVRYAAAIYSAIGE